MTISKRTPTLSTLYKRRANLHGVAAGYGASNLRVFGSVARGESDESSDVDLLVDIDADAHGFAYFGLLEDLRRALEAEIGAPVGLVDAAGLKTMRKRVLAEAITL